jgi:hypothetical protein
MISRHRGRRSRQEWGLLSPGLRILNVARRKEFSSSMQLYKQKWKTATNKHTGMRIFLNIHTPFFMAHTSHNIYRKKILFNPLIPVFAFHTGKRSEKIRKDPL